LRERAAAETWFHICPTRKILLAAADCAKHPIRRLLDASCNLTLNSDDPNLLGASITDGDLHAAFDLGFSGRRASDWR
jgi:adenosine deaminase